MSIFTPKSPVTFCTSWLFGCSAYYINYHYAELYFDMICCCLIILTTSLLYHYTHNKFIRIIDMICVQLALFYGTYNTFAYHLYYIIAMVMLIKIAVIYFKFNKNDYTHAILHFYGSLGIVLCVNAHYLTNNYSTQ
jgi:hypothetical protein